MRGWAPTSSSPTSSPRRTGSSSCGTSRRSAATTNVADHPEFADRKTTKVIDGVSYTGWFTDDFTLAELKTLRAKERLPDVRQRNTIYDGRYEIPTFQEVIDLRASCRRSSGGPIGIVPEIKHSTYFRPRASRSSPSSCKALRDNGLDKADSPVVVQSFETANLKELDDEIDVPLVALLDSPTSVPDDVRPRAARARSPTWRRPRGCKGLATFADWVGPSKAYIIPTDAAGEWQAPTSLRRRRARRGPEGRPVHVPQREPVPAAVAALVGGPERLRRRVLGVQGVLRPRRRRRLLRQPGHGGRRPGRVGGLLLGLGDACEGGVHRRPRRLHDTPVTRRQARRVEGAQARGRWRSPSGRATWPATAAASAAWAPRWSPSGSRSRRRRRSRGCGRGCRGTRRAPACGPARR